MKKNIYLLLIILLIYGNEKVLAQTAIFSPGMTITGFNSVNAPVAEDLDKAIDGTTTKFLDFDEFDGMGFTVNLGGPSLRARSIEITTANDSPDRDPMEYEVFGSTDGTTFTSIGTGAIPCIFTRFAVRQFNFTNNTSYTYYRINFATRCGTPSEMQVAEVQLYDDYFCTAPSNLTANNITTTTADLSWTETWLATTWDIEFGVSGFSPTGTPTINNTTSNPHSLTGLTAGTAYDFYVKADCGGSTSSWSGPYSFSTDCIVSGPDCSGFGGLDIGDITCGGSPYNYADNLTGANDDCSQRTGPDHMYTFTLPVASDVTITVCDPAYDGYIYLYDVANGNCNSGNIAFNDDSGCGSVITQSSLAAGTYVLVITTYGSSDPADGSYALTLDVSNCSNTGDEPCDAISASVTCGSKVTSTNVGKTNSGIPSPACGNYAGGDIWFETIIPASGIMDIEVVSVLSSISDVGIAAYTGALCSGSLTEISCDNNSMPSLSLTGLTSGDMLYIRVWENGNNTTGQFELEVTDPSNLYCLNGDAGMYNFPTDTCMQVSADAADQKGCAWYQNTLDFSQSFDHTLEVFLGSDDGGADGMTFVFHNDPLGTSICGNDGAGLGAVGISNALVIEIDTYDNDNPNHIWDIAEDHVAVWTSNSGYTNPIAGPIAATSPSSDIEDGAVHQLRLFWNAVTNTLEVYFDGNLRLTVTDDFVANVFGSKNVFWGSTAATGLFTNQMYVCPPRSLINPILSVDNGSFIAMCNGNNIDFNWVNEDNSNIRYFEIEKSIDGILFENTNIIAVNESKLYNLSIKNDNRCEYFRLKKVSVNNKETYSDVKKLVCLEREEIEIYSDIENSKIYFNFNDDMDNVSIEIYSLEGKILHNSLLVNEKQYMLDVSDCASGIYFAKVKVEGKAPIIKKLYIKS